MSRPSIDDLARALDAARPGLDLDGGRLVRALYEELTKGSPVQLNQLSTVTGIDERSVRQALDDWPGVFTDADGRVIAFWGLALSEMGHGFEIDGTRLYTWCAFDPLVIAPFLGRTVRVTSTCPVTGLEITLTVGPEGYKDLEPSTAVLSFLEPDESWGDDVIERFCHYVLLFASTQAGEQWVAKNPGTFLLSLDEAFDLAQRWFERVVG